MRRSLLKFIASTFSLIAALAVLALPSPSQAQPSMCIGQCVDTCPDEDWCEWCGGDPWCKVTGDPGCPYQLVCA